ncbi:MAG: hypothetical protein ACOYWZ_06140 [Bacillota bacterium]
MGFILLWETPARYMDSFGNVKVYEIIAWSEEKDGKCKTRQTGRKTLLLDVSR